MSTQLSLSPTVEDSDEEVVEDSPVEVYSVPGTHTTMLAEPQVQVLADKLSGRLDRVYTATRRNLSV